MFVIGSISIERAGAPGSQKVTIKLTTRESGPSQFNFCGPGYPNPFKCITRVKLRVFVFKVAISGPHLIFSYSKCNAIIRAGFTIWLSARGPEALLRMVTLGAGFRGVTLYDVTPLLKIMSKSR